jgi:hypothetical protein
MYPAPERRGFARWPGVVVPSRRGWPAADPVHCSRKQIAESLRTNTSTSAAPPMHTATVGRLAGIPACLRIPCFAR